MCSPPYPICPASCCTCSLQWVRMDVLRHLPEQVWMLWQQNKRCQPQHTATLATTVQFSHQELLPIAPVWGAEQRKSLLQAGSMHDSSQISLPVYPGNWNVRGEEKQSLFFLFLSGKLLNEKKKKDLCICSCLLLGYIFFLFFFFLPMLSFPQPLLTPTSSPYIPGFWGFWVLSSFEKWLELCW